MNSEKDSLDVFDMLRNLSLGELKAEFIPYSLQFKVPGKTSRGTMHNRDIWFLKVYEKNYPQFIGIGECAPLPGLSIEPIEEIQDKLVDVCIKINQWEELLNEDLIEFPSILFALEQALLDLRNQGSKILFPSKFTDGNELIAINGLIWMGNPQYMIDQINEKIHQGFRCLKLKVGTNSIQDELNIIREIRNTFGFEDIEIRLDANGAFHPEEVLQILNDFSEYDIHSIEQPISTGKWDEMSELCRLSPIPIALDEELIGIQTREEAEELLNEIMPSYIILKPSLLGGFRQCEEWIELAEQYEIGWWITSALESNVGLNAIAQWTFTKQNPMYQGLGTGQIFTNNIDSPLYLDGEHLMYDPSKKWKINW